MSRNKQFPIAKILRRENCVSRKSHLLRNDINFVGCRKVIFMISGDIMSTLMDTKTLAVDTIYIRARSKIMARYRFNLPFVSRLSASFCAE